MTTQKPLRIFVDAHVFDAGFQGTRTFIRELYVRLANVPGLVIFLAAKDIENLRKEFPDHTNLRFVPLKSNGSIKRLLFELPSLHKRLQIDIAHYQYVAPPIKNTRYLITTHDVLFNDYPEEFSGFYRYSKNLLFGYSARQADLLTTVSAYSKFAIAKHLKVGGKPITVIPNGVDDRFFGKYDKAGSQRYISDKFSINKYLLYVSRFEPRKNHIQLLRAFVDLKLYLKGFHLVLLGHKSLQVTDFQSFYETLAPEIRNSVFISSNVNNKDLLEFYRAATVFVYPSKAEGFGIPPLEAGALKIPVLCSNTSAMQDFTFFEENHIDPNDYDAFKKRLNHIVVNGIPEEQLARISTQIQVNYSWNHSARILSDLLTSRQ